jgi:hypothetical protein
MPKLPFNQSLKSMGYNLANIPRAIPNELSFSRITSSSETPFGLSGASHFLTTSGPAVSSYVSNRLDLFIRGTDKALWHRWLDRGWHEWESLGGILTSGPAAVSGIWEDSLGGTLTKRIISVFVRGTDNALWHKWFDGSWHDWESLGGVLTSGPAAVSWDKNRIDVFAGVADTILGRTLWDGSSWHDWEEWPYPDARERPIPNGFKRLDLSSDSEDFEHWGKYTTSYSSSGFIGTSQRWDNSKMEALNMVAGFQFKIGPDAVPIWKDIPGLLQPRRIYDRSNPSVLLYFPRARQVPIPMRGSYILEITSFVSMTDDPGDHPIPPSEGRANKEIPHPKYAGIKPLVNEDTPRDPAPPNIGIIRDGKWHGFLAAVYNDLQTGWPMMKLWYNHRATHNMADYIYLGSCPDSPDKPMGRGSPLTHDVVGVEDIFIGAHPLRIRIDGIRRDQLEIRDMYAVAVAPENITAVVDTGGGTIL